MPSIASEKNVILYADDDQDDLMLVKDAFNKYSSYIEVVTAVNGSEALSYLKNLSIFDPTPCLIILDINMPLVNGKEVLKQIRVMERYKHTPAILFSTSSHHFERKFAEDYNAAFISKPMDMGELEEIINQFIDRCSSDVKNGIRNN